MSNQTFGAWLLGQRERQDTTGSLARAWVQLKEARGYTHSTLKSIKELLSSALGEDWGAMHGNETLAAAEAEWKSADAPTALPQQPDPEPYFTGGKPPGVQAVHPGPQTGPFQGMNYLVQDAAAPPLDDHVVNVVNVPPMAVLVFAGHTYELTPGRRYELTVNPVLRDATSDGEIEQTPAYGPAGEILLNAPTTVTVLAREDGGINWAALYDLADRNLPDGADLASLGLDDAE